MNREYCAAAAALAISARTVAASAILLVAVAKFTERTCLPPFSLITRFFFPDDSLSIIDLRCLID